jgi:hypothetical protein
MEALQVDEANEKVVLIAFMGDYGPLSFYFLFPRPLLTKWLSLCYELKTRGVVDTHFATINFTFLHFSA